MKKLERREIAKPQHDYIARASTDIESAIEYDQKYPELGEIFGQVYGDIWAPFEWNKVITIPDQIFEHYNQTQCITQMGLFAEIQRVWISVDNKLFLWNIHKVNDFLSFKELENSITAVALVNPKKNVFVDTIKYLLVIATTIEISILGLSEKDDQLSFFKTNLKTDLPGIFVKNLVSTAKGRVFFITNNDSHIYEVDYKNSQQVWFGRACSLINRTAGIFEFILPNFLINHSQREKINQIVVDDSRDLLYTLSNNLVVQCYSLSGTVSFECCMTFSYSTLLSQAQMINVNSSLLDLKSSSIASISAVDKKFSSQINLIAITSTGCRLFIRVAKLGLFSFNENKTVPNTMQLIHVRFPPADTFKDKKFNCFSTHKGPGLFIGVVENEKASSHSLFLTAPNIGKISLSYRAKVQPILYESATLIPLEGFVQSVMCLSNNNYGVPNELACQHDSEAFNFAVLTNFGVHIISRNRPQDILIKALQKMDSGSNPSDIDLRQFLDNFGRVEACATSLGVIVNSLNISNKQDRMLHFNNPDKNTIDIARQCYIDFGGKPHFEEISFSIQSPEVRTIDSVRLSGRHAGLALFLSRCFRNFWYQPIIRSTQNSKNFCSNIAFHDLVALQTREVSLIQYLEENKKYIDGLAGPEIISYGNEALDIARQAEHRGMYSLLVFLQRSVEAISFICFLIERSDNYLSNIISMLSESSRESILKMTIRDFIANEKQGISKELLTAIFNNQILKGLSVDTIGESLRKRCGSFCSMDDVIIFKSMELLKKTKTANNKDRSDLLHESLLLLQSVVTSIDLTTLNSVAKELYSLNYHPGGIQLIIAKAETCDPERSALKYYLEGQRETDPRKSYFNQRKQYYDIAFEGLEELESLRRNFEGEEKEKIAENLSQVTYKIINSSSDELFHYLYFDWLVDRGQKELLSSSESPFIVKYLKTKSQEKVELSDYLYQILAKNSQFIEAAQTLLHLAQSAENVDLKQRIAYLSIARSYCGCYIPENFRKILEELSLNLQELLEIAGIQHEIMSAALIDQTLDQNEKQATVASLNNKILTLSDLFNKFADRLHYYEICLIIFYISDYRDENLVSDYWEKLLKSITERHSSDSNQAFKALADCIQRVGQRVSDSSVIFPLKSLLTMACQLNLQLGSKDSLFFTHWVPESFHKAGIQPLLIISTLNEILQLGQYPFDGKLPTFILIGDILYMTNIWVEDKFRQAAATEKEETSFVKRLLESFMNKSSLNYEQQVNIQEKSQKLLTRLQNYEEIVI